MKTIACFWQQARWRFQPLRPGQRTMLTLQLKWVTQAQFAGYYVAKGQGLLQGRKPFDVDIKPGGPDIAPAQVLAGGGADVVLDWMPSCPGDPRERAWRWSTSHSPSSLPA